MDEFRDSYVSLFRTVSEAIAAIDAQNYGKAREILIQGQQQAEELYMDAEESSTHTE